MFEKLYVERLAEVFDKMPVDHDRSDQKASNLDGWNFYGKQHTECKQSESHDGPERMWADHNDQGKENKEKPSTARSSSRVFHGAPNRIRTCGLLIRRLSLIFINENRYAWLGCA